MTLPPDVADELRELLHALCEDALTDDQSARLEVLLRTDAEAVAFYVAFMHQQADLSRHFGVARPPLALAPTPGSTVPRPPPKRSSRRLRMWAMLGTAAVAASVVLMLALGRMSLPPKESAAAEPTDGSVALLVQAADPDWDETGMPTRVGAPLPPGRLRLKSGLAQVQFYCGATVILEGPAELELLTTTQARCLRGKLRASVPPPAVGFTIETPGLHVVDRGTEFGVDVAATGPTEVHVFQGQVDLYHAADPPAGPPRQALLTGQAARFASSTRLDRIDADAPRFVSAQQLADRSQIERLRRQKEWRLADLRLADDSTLAAHFAFNEPTTPTILQNQVRPGDGTVIGCPWADGRWTGKRALEFKRVGDRVRVEVPGEFASLTLVVWARVDALPHRLNSLLMSDNYPVGALHWQLSAAGEVVLGVQDPTQRNGASYTSPPVLTPARLGQWMQLAVVYDKNARQVTHYVDGRPISRHPLQFDVPLRIGRAEMGNWSPTGFPDARPIRNFVGRMDELLLYSRPLTDADVARLYEQGRP
jgi:ferric-dicitrate binding protein FerR (iron transport regulator)